MFTSRKKKLAEKTKPKIGARVRVWKNDGTDVEFGTYLGEIAACDSEHGKESGFAEIHASELPTQKKDGWQRFWDSITFSGHTVAKIALDSGRVIYSEFECRYEVISEDDQA